MFSPLLLAALAALVTLAVGLLVVSRYDWNFSALLLTGEGQFPDEVKIKTLDLGATHFFLEDYFHQGAVIHKGQQGYDGSYYYVIARDPLQLDRTFAPGFKLHNQHRYQRFLFPLAAWALAVGRPAAIPLAMFAINVFCVGVTVWAAARIARIDGTQPAWMLPAALSGGLLFAAVYSMTFPLCMALASLAILADRTRGPAAAMPFWAAALLAREHALVLVGAFGLAYLLRRNWKGAFWTALAGVPFAIYQIITMIVHPNPALGGSTFFLAPPFSGMIDMLRAVPWQASPGRIAISLSPVVVIAFVLMSGVYAARSLRRCVDAIPIAILACTALAICSYAEWWVTFVNATRVNVPIFLLTGLLFARKKDIIGAFLIMLSTAVSLAMLLRIVTRAWGPYHLIP